MVHVAIHRCNSRKYTFSFRQWLFVELASFISSQNCQKSILFGRFNKSLSEGLQTGSYLYDIEFWRSKPPLIVNLSLRQSNNCIAIIDFNVQDLIIDVNMNSYNSVPLFKVITKLTE